jgi:hypothetical protein
MKSKLGLYTLQNARLFLLCYEISFTNNGWGGPFFSWAAFSFTFFVLFCDGHTVIPSCTFLSTGKRDSFRIYMRFLLACDGWDPTEALGGTHNVMWSLWCIEFPWRIELKVTTYLNGKTRLGWGRGLGRRG